MHDLQDRRYDMFTRVDLFWTRSADSSPLGSLGREYLDVISEGLAEVQHLRAAQTAGFGDAMESTKTKTRARKSLLLHLRRIIRTARFIGRTIPGFDEPFKLPRGQSDAALLYTARQFVERATPVMDVFIKFSMPANFIEDLETDVRDIERQNDERSTFRGKHKESTASIDAVMKKCMAALQNLDVVVTNSVTDRTTLAVWKTARRVHRSRQRKAAAATGAP